MLTTLAQQLISDIRRLVPDEQIDTRQLKTLMESSLRRLNIVSRDEFDAQAAVLQRTRQQLDDLSQQLDQLQQSLPTAEKKH